MTEKNWYDKYYKLLLLPPVLFLAICLIYLFSFHAKTGDILIRDASLSGGTTITLTGELDPILLETQLRNEFPDVHIRTIGDVSIGATRSVIIDSGEKPENLKPIIERIVGFELTSDNSSIEFSGPTLSNNFYKQLMIALAVSFFLMSLVIFFLFRSFIPSIAVIFAAFADIVMPLAVLNYFEVRISAAGIAAFLMLVGYSVDTDILLTTRVLKKRGGNVNHRIYSSFKTGMFMTITALLAVLPAFLVVTSLPDSFRQIFLILSIGLVADIVNTWLTNASIIKWYATAKGLE